MELRVDYNQLVQEIREDTQKQRLVLRKVSETLRKVSFLLERAMKQHGGEFSIPRDTGRAAASWGHWTAGDTNNPDSNPGDARWEERDNGLTIEQGSNVEYMGALNDGHSKQQTAGFIDRAEEHFVKVLEQEVDRAMSQLGF